MKARYLSLSVSVAAFATLLGTSGLTFSAENEQPHSNSALTAISDSAITAKVKTKFMDDTRLKNADINVNTTNGVVTLKGSAPDAKASSAAEDMAAHVEGVVRVDNKIFTPSVSKNIGEKTKVATKNAERVASDSWITTKVKSALLADSLTKGLQISVTTKNHVVILTGAVGTQAAFDQATHLASQIKNVKSVDTTNLKIIKE